MRQLLGFDVRQPGDVYLRQLWSAEKRRELLLAPEVIWPLSVDWRVWPSVFWDPMWIDYPPDHLAEYTIEVDRTEPRYEVLHLWADCVEMRETLLSSSRRSSAVVTVAIHLEDDGRSSSQQQWDAVLTPSVIECTRVAWRHEGYDVANEHLMSALGFIRVRAFVDAKQQALWAGHLNKSGLFTDINNAISFCDVLDRRFPSHYGFRVFSLSVAEENSQAEPA